MLLNVSLMMLHIFTAIYNKYIKNILEKLL